MTSRKKKKLQSLTLFANVVTHLYKAVLVNDITLPGFLFLPTKVTPSFITDQQPLFILGRYVWEGEKNEMLTHDIDSDKTIR